ncbi:MAG TPA: hypothetical protein VKY85_14700 [Candidatus Angelobacter sp.]|nr:hypothetical protein [Candidatus Angelobacter sp.]
MFTRMLGSLPGWLGFAAFAGVKLVGYGAAGAVLRRVYPDGSAGPFKVAITRTGVGLAVGLSNIAFWAWVESSSGSSGGEIKVPFLTTLVVLRLAIWTFIIRFFCDRKWTHPQRDVTSIVAGTALSFLLDAAGIALALTPPRQGTFC